MPPDQCKRDLDELARIKKELEARIAQMTKSIADQPDDLRKKLQDRLAQKNKAIDDQPHRVR